MNIINIISYIIVGTLTGLFMATIGADGLITVPALCILGLSLKKAVIIALILQALPQTIPALYTFWKNYDITKELVYISLLIIFGNFIGTYSGSFIHTKNLLSEDLTYQICRENIDLIDELNLTGAPIKDIVNNFNLKIETNNLESLKPIISQATYDQLLESDIGFQSDIIIEKNDNTYIFEIDSIYDSYLIPLEDSREEIKKRLIINKTNEQQEIKISDIELL